MAAAPSRDPTAAKKNPAENQECGHAALPLGSRGFQEEAAVTENVLLQACSPVPKCCDLLMETGGVREHSGKINSSQRKIEFKCCYRRTPPAGSAGNYLRHRGTKMLPFHEANDLIKMYVHDNALAARESRSYLLQLRHFPCPCPGKG